MISLLRLEDLKRPYLGPNYWILKKMGLLLPENKSGKIIYILMHAMGSLFVLSQFMELYVIKSDLDLILNNMKVSMVSFICVVKANTFLFWQSSWREILSYVTAADKFERSNSDVAKGRIIASYTKYSRRVTYFYWILVFATCLITMFTPLIKYLSSTTFRENFRNGTEPFPHIFSSWMPFDKTISPGSWITVLWHIAICIYGSGVVLAYDSSIIAIMVFFGGKLDLLRERCKQMFGHGDFEINDDEFRSVVRQLHQIHVLLIRYSRLFNSLLSPVMFIYTVVCSLMICANAFQISSSTTNATQKLLTAEYLIFGIAQLFIFCWHSNDVLVKNDNVSLGPYESDWWIASPRQRKYIHILSGQLRIKNIFTAGPFADLTLSTFIMILKGAYSYYTLLSESSSPS